MKFYLISLFQGSIQNITHLLSNPQWTIPYKIMEPVRQDLCFEGKSKVRRSSMLCRVSKLIVTLVDEDHKIYEGTLIGENIVLTTAAVLQQQKPQKITVKFRIGTVQDKQNTTTKVSLLTSENFQDNCVALKLEKNIKRRRFMSLVSEYHPMQTYQKLQEDRHSGISLSHYQIGDHLTILPSEIRFAPNSRNFRILADTKNYEIGTGCPLLVVFSNRQCYAIGLLQTPTQGYIFSLQFYWNIWRTLHFFFQESVHLITTRMQQWKQVNLSLVQPPYVNVNLYDLSYQSEDEYHPQEVTVNYGDFEEIRNFNLAKYRMREIIHQKYQSQCNKILNIYSKYYGYNNQIQASECYQSLRKVEQQTGMIVYQQKVAEEAKKLVRVARRQNNMLIYVLGRLKYGALVVREDAEQAKRCFQGCRKYVEKLGCKMLRFRLNQGMMAYYEQTEDEKKIIQTYELAAKWALQDLKTSYFKYKIELVRYNLYFKRPLVAIDHLRESFQHLSKYSQQEGKEIKEKLFDFIDKMIDYISEQSPNYKNNQAFVDSLTAIVVYYRESMPNLNESKNIQIMDLRRKKEINIVQTSTFNEEDEGMEDDVFLQYIQTLPGQN